MKRPLGAGEICVLERRDKGFTDPDIGGDMCHVTSIYHQIRGD